MKGKGSAATIAIAVLTGVIAAALALWSVRRRPDAISDFDQAIVGARVLFAGGNPYDYIGPGRAWDYLWPLYYPAPALIVARPFSLFSIPVARAAFIGLGMGIFAWALLRNC